MALIELRDVTRMYGPASAEGVTALNGVSLMIESGEQVSLVGSSGSGKSTLLNLIGGIDLPTSGTITVEGRDIGTIGDKGMTMLRRELIGIVFQFFNLMPTLSVLENVTLPAELAGKSESESRARAMELLRGVGMEGRASHKPSELSGGEMQRTAIARALINRPKILLADEPTGNLDSHNGNLVLDLLRRVAADEGLTLVMATHDPAIAAQAGRTVEMRDGRVVSDQRREAK
ncbi:MAG: ABC transporter ATP-binding protein [Bacteroidota bacterium]